MMEIPVHDHQGKVVETIQFDESCLGRAVHKSLLHQVVVAYEANQRVGTSSTKRRNEVVGTKAKPWRQKGTGRARVGSKRNPVWRGGGSTFGPKPRDYSHKVSKKARRVALKSAILGKLRDGEVKVVADLDLPAPKTREMAAILKSLETGKSTLVVTKVASENTYKSARNLPNVDIMILKDMNAYKALQRQTLVMSKDAFTAIPEELK